MQRQLNCLLFLLVFSLFGFANANNFLANNSFSNIDLFSSPEQSFNKLSVIETQNKGEITLCWRIPKGQYLYKNKISIQLQHADQAKLGEIYFPPASTHPVFKNEPVYTNQVLLRIPLSGEITPNSKLEVKYQSCDNNLCHLPQIKEIAIDQNVLPYEQNDFNWLGILALLGVGLLLAFTPCVLPMLPIISAIVVGKNHSKFYSFLLALSYVLGMSVMYAILGIIISSIGLSFQIFFQQSWVIVLLAGLFSVLALSMFGAFQIQLPQALSARLGQSQHNIKTGGIFASFLMGAIASLVLSPCTSAPLIGVLTTIVQTGDILYGGVALFALGFGMGVPLMLIALGLKRFVPKSGAWMQEIKVIFGFAMLTMAIFLLGRITLLETIIFSLYALLISAYLLYLVYASVISASIQQKTKHFIATIILFLALLTIVANHTLHTTNKPTTASTQNDFTTVFNSQELKQQVTLALKTHQYVLIDYFAHWCENCLKLKAILLSPTMQDYFKKNNIKVIKVDVSDYNANSTALLKTANVLGLPTLILRNQQNNEIKRIAGVVDVNTLKQQFNTVLSKEHLAIN
ncbi:protein-disulfide reductase DsbD [Cysteiniphilum sp. QT6929]|uniref:protein-disulfide reductase DsbD n=1 Tax=Cysteiniphilum sp. QT6929 TaxID=2975055 RepID=UPI0024B3C55E|nr:protein-disulfide reductase DsbD [Cysteiniphilum sp. QT6929]WHN66597.1 protein-disulfide reductase DsbD [Cysteiniphilum sp. QT6929]